jgi:hypothetical protein
MMNTGMAFIEDAPLKPPHLRETVAVLLARLSELDNEQLASLSMALESEHINRMAALSGCEPELADMIF